MKILDNFGNFLEKIDRYRDELLFLFIKPCWPKSITPNHITYVRIVMGTALFFMLFFFGIENKIIMILLFGIGALTDLFDGSVARGLNKVTDFGATLDIIADRILVLPIAVYSLYQSEKWLLFALLIFEFIGAIIAAFHESRQKYVVNIFAKTKMVLWVVVFVAILVVWPDPIPLFFVYVLCISLVFSFLSIITRIKTYEAQSKNL